MPQFVRPEDTALVIPVLNPGRHLDQLLPAIARQTFRPGQFLVIDSASDDGSIATMEAAGARVHRIERRDFDHGGTRQVGVDLVGEARFVLFLTQDAVPADPEAFGNLVSAFADERVGVAFGRQLPHLDAGPVGAHARLFSYADRSYVCTPESAPTFGVRASFCSNSFAAYRVAALRAVGGFPSGTIFGEDSICAGRMLLAGWSKAYVAQACVHHSHDYSLAEDFRRYFDVGVLHAREPWMVERFGRAEGEGGRFVRSELGYLARHAPVRVPEAMVRTALKLAAYRLGRAEARLPNTFKQRISLNRGFWRREAQAG